MGVNDDDDDDDDDDEKFVVKQRETLHVFGSSECV